MICRKCSAVIPDGSEKCPVCKKFPGKKQKASGRIISLAVILFCIVFAAAFIYIALDISDYDVSRIKNDLLYLTDKEKDKASTVEFPFEMSIEEYNAFSSDDSGFIRGELKISESSFSALSPSQFKAFLAAAEAYGNYCWITVSFENGKGISFASANDKAIPYGTVSDDGRIYQPQGYILLKENDEYVYKAVSSEAHTTVTEAVTESIEATVVSETTETVEEAEASLPEKESETVSESETVQDNSSDKSGKTVYITPSGTKYHRSTCRYISDTARAISVNDAKAKGYGACKVCKP